MITQLYPVNIARPLKGAYLEHRLREQVVDDHEVGELSDVSKPYVYANFVTSLDGRIAVPHPSGEGLTVPRNIANDRDWRLFQELATQADLIISTGRYLRDWAEGRAQEILRVDEPEFADLRTWRLEQGLAPQPDIAIVSGSLDFPIPAILTTGGRNVIVFTTANADPDLMFDVETKAGKLYTVGEDSIDGAQMVKNMGELGYKTVYSAAGPKILHLLLDSNVLDRLYLTQTSRIIGGTPHATIVEGSLLEKAADFALNTLYWDLNAFPQTNGCENQTLNAGQLFMSYERISAVSVS